MKRIPALIFAVLALAVTACGRSSMCPDPPCSAGGADTTGVSSVDAGRSDKSVER